MGTRVGADGNKAYLPLAGRSMVSWSVEAVARSANVARTILVFRRGERDLAARTLAAEVPQLRVELVEGGDTRHGSEENVLRHLAPDIESGAVDVVLVHDAARPLASPAMMDTAVTTARTRGGAIPVLPAADVVETDLDGRLSPPTARSSGSRPRRRSARDPCSPRIWPPRTAASRAPTPRRACRTTPTWRCTCFPAPPPISR